jgi:hypothetical protein
MIYFVQKKIAGIYNNNKNHTMSNYRFHSPHIVKPWSNVNGRYVNVGNTHNPSNFGSNETSREFGLSGIVNNVKAAAASILSANMKGGRTKKNKMSRKYIMGKKSCLVRRTIRRFTKMAKTVGRKLMRRKSSRKQSVRRNKRGMRGGGYLQYGSNAAANAAYETGPFVPAGGLPAHGLLANPAPFSPVGGNCPNAYRH